MRTTRIGYSTQYITCIKYLCENAYVEFYTYRLTRQIVRHRVFNPTEQIIFKSVKIPREYYKMLKRQWGRLAHDICYFDSIRSELYIAQARSTLYQSRDSRVQAGCTARASHRIFSHYISICTKLNSMSTSN